MKEIQKEKEVVTKGRGGKKNVRFRVSSSSLSIAPWIVKVLINEVVDKSNCEFDMWVVWIN